jgi:hypothetical protein
MEPAGGIESLLFHRKGEANGPGLMDKLDVEFPQIRQCSPGATGSARGEGSVLAGWLQRDQKLWVPVSSVAGVRFRTQSPTTVLRDCSTSRGLD